MAGWLVLRPTFQFLIEGSRDAAIERLNHEFQQRNEPSSFLMHGEYGELHLPSYEHRLWSPHLSFYVTEQDGRAKVHGRFAPRVDIWTTVWILYLAMAFTAFFSFTMAYSQWAINESSWWHWPGIVSLLAIVAIYLVAQIGQQWSADQMVKLRKSLDELMEKAKIGRMSD